MKCHLDFETRSPLDLTKVGVYRYAEEPETGIWLFCYRFDSEPIQEWSPQYGPWRPPTRLLDHVASGGTIVAHNANFERQIWNTVLRRQPGCERWHRLSIGQMDCTMARALAIHLPPDLDTLAQVLGLPEQKDKEGRRLMLLMSKPRKRDPFVWWDEPERIDRLGLYCDQDVLTESAIDAKLPPLSAEEREIWELDQRINDRGVALDVDSIERCVKVLEVAQERANERMSDLTGGFVRKVTEATRIVEWLKQRGIPADSIAKNEQSGLALWTDILGDEKAAEVIRLRAEAGRSSTAKFKTMLSVVCADGRARGLLNYHKANTGRWGGAMIQPQNLPRVDEDTELPAVLGALEIMEGAT